VELAAALYVQGLAEGKQGGAALRQAASLLDGASAEVRAIHDVQKWREWVRQAEASST
jgi:hypothetical protein